MSPFLLFILIWVPTTAAAVVVEYFGNYRTISMTTLLITVLITWAAAMGIVCYIRFRQMRTDEKPMQDPNQKVNNNPPDQKAAAS